MNTLRWRLPYPPTTSNHMYFTLPNGARRLRPIAEKWLNDVITLIRDGGKPKTPPGLLSLRLDVHPPDAKRRDASNIVKLTEDAVAAALEFDDVRVTLLTVRKHRPTKVARLEVELTTDEEGMLAR